MFVLKKVDLVIVAFFLVVFVSAHLFGWFDVTTPIYERGVVENLEGAFNLPLLYWVGVPFYLLLGSLAFPFLSLFFLLVSVFFILKSFSLFRLEKGLVLFGFLSTSRWIPTLCFFNRDNLMFALASAFAFFFFRAVYLKCNRSLGLQVLIVFLMLFTKTSGALFLFIFLVEIVYFYRKKIVNLFPAFFFFDVVKEHWNQVIGAWNALPSLRLWFLFAFCANPIFGASALVFAKKHRDMIHLGVLVLTSLAVACLFALVGGENYIGRFLRYTNPLVPFHLFCFAYAVGPVRGFRWVKVLGVFGLAKIVSGLFYLDAIWRLFL